MSSLKKSALLGLLGLALGRPAGAAFDKGGVLGVGARPVGMGSAFVAIADDSTAINWNPAGMVQVPRMELSAFFGPLLNGKEYYMSGAFVMPFLEQTAMGLSLVTLYHDTGNADTRAFENQFIASFATPLNVEKTVSFGVNLKFLQYDSQARATLPGTGQTIEAKASAVGMDLGALYQVLLPAWGKKVSFGFLAQDLDTVLRWQSGVEERVPLMVQAGIAYFPEENLAFAVDYSFFNDTNISGQPLNQPLYDSNGNTITTLEPQQHRPHVGIEGWFFNGHLGLRTGYTGFATTADRFTGGVSYRQDWYGVDYAYMGHAEHLGDSHRLSAHVHFGGSAERPRVVALVNPPSNIQARPNNNSVQLQWEPNPDPHVTGYTVYMSKASGANYVPIQKRIKENKVIIDGLTNGQRYYFVVTSVNNSWPSVESNYSAEVSAVPAPQIPGAPSLGGGPEPAQAAPQNGVILVKGWAVPAGSVGGYNLYMSETSGSGYRKVNTDGPITGPSFLVQNLEVNKRYYFVLTSLSTDNPPVESRPSAEWSLNSVPAGSLPQSAPAPR
jgi:hypothetical protein